MHGHVLRGGAQITSCCEACSQYVLCVAFFCYGPPHNDIFHLGQKHQEKQHIIFCVCVCLLTSFPFHPCFLCDASFHQRAFKSTGLKICSYCVCVCACVCVGVCVCVCVCV